MHVTLGWKLVKLSDKLAAAFAERYQGLVLLGSWARGAQTGTSDVDLLVLVRDASADDELLAIRVGLEQPKERYSISACSLEQLQRGVIDQVPFCLHVTSDGVPFGPCTNGSWYAIATRKESFDAHISPRIPIC